MVSVFKSLGERYVTRNYWSVNLLVDSKIFEHFLRRNVTFSLSNVVLGLFV